MKVLYITFTILLFSIGVHAQPITKNVISNIATHISSGLFRYYQPDTSLTNHLCRQGIIFIKFRVDTQQRIVDFALSKDSATFIQTELTKAVEALRKDKELMVMMAKFKLPVIQPFMYYYQNGCHLTEILEGKGDNESDAEHKMHYYKRREEMNHLTEALFSMINFNGSWSPGIPCLLLSPISLGAGAIY